MERIPFQFCPQCGTKLQSDFKFCPSCGVRLPCPDDKPVAVGMTASLGLSPPEKNKPLVAKTSLALGLNHEHVEGKSQTCTTSIQVTARSPLQKTRNSPRLEKFGINTVAPPSVPSCSSAKEEQSKEPCVVASLFDPVMEATSELPSSPVKTPPRATRAKAKVFSPAMKQVDETKKLNETETFHRKSKVKESTVYGSPVSSSSPTTLQIATSPFKGKNKAKKAKYTPTVAPLQEGEELTDTTGRKWTLVKLQSQSMTEAIYKVSQSNYKESNHILKLGAKDGRIYNEQNFLQRAAKPTSVEKWMKQNKMDFLGIPSCVGFGLHADSYRFLVFSNMGRSLQSVMEEEKTLLSEAAVLQLTCRILDVLYYIHENEYVHADINAGNIYIQQGDKTKIFLVGYCHAFRFCPGGKHVEYRQDSRTPHEGAIEFISLDTHKGAAPSRRSDLQSLAYCMLHWHTGTLPWSGLTHPSKVAAEKQRYMEDVPALLSHCFGKNKASSAFKTYVSAAMALQYTELPDYSALRGGLSEALLQQGDSLDQSRSC